MKKLFLTISLFFLLTCPAWATTYYAKNVTGNWADASSWSATGSGGADSVGVPTAAIDVVFDSGYTGNITIGAAATAKSLVVDAGATGTLTHGAFNLTVAGNCTFVSGFHYSPLATSTLTISATGTLTSAGLLLSNVTISGGNFTVGDNLSFMASPLISLTIGGTAFDMNGKSINGNSAINRILIKSNTLGTAKTITNATTSFTNSDFRDIAFSSASSLDLSGITGGSGDCGGNSITGGGTTLTFTPAADPTTVTGSSSNWSTATWDVRVPLPQDRVVISLTAGQTLTADVPRLGGGLGTGITFSTATKLTVANPVTSYGSLDFSNCGTINYGSYAHTFESQARSGTIYLTSNGKTIGGTSQLFNINVVNTTLQLQDALVIPSSGAMVLNNGTLSSAYNITAAFSSSNSNIRAIGCTGGTWTLLGSGNSWNIGLTTNLSVNFSNHVIAFSDTGASGKIFTSAGLSYDNLSVPSGTGGVSITGANTFNNITVAAGGKLKLPSTMTNTVNNFTAIGTQANPITLLASTPGSAATLTKSGAGTVKADYLDITDVNVTPANTWYYGNNSVWHSGTGWMSGFPPSIKIIED